MVFFTRWLALSTAISLATAYICKEFSIPLDLVDVPALTTTFAPFTNDLESVQFLNDITNRVPGRSPLGTGTRVSAKVNIATQYCVPNTTYHQGPVQLLTHGIGFDHSYWDFGGAQSEYNYIEAATKAGYATLSYDRIGNGNSTKADPYMIQQIGTQTAILIELTKLLRAGELSKYAGCSISRPSKVIHVGHSFGSRVTAELSSLQPELSDGLVLTGFSTNNSYQSAFGISSNFHIASKSDPVRFGEYDNGYLTWADKEANQYPFFTYPYFSADILTQAESVKQPFAVGEALTVGIPVASGVNFRGPVLVISGEHDRIYCGGDCIGILDQARAVYAASKTFETYVQPNMGHVLNLHLNTTAFYDVVNSWVRSHVQ